MSRPDRLATPEQAALVQAMIDRKNRERKQLSDEIEAAFAADPASRCPIMSDPVMFALACARMDGLRTEVLRLELLLTLPLVAGS